MGLPCWLLMHCPAILNRKRMQFRINRGIDELAFPQVRGTPNKNLRSPRAPEPAPAPLNGRNLFNF